MVIKIAALSSVWTCQHWTDLIRLEITNHLKYKLSETKVWNVYRELTIKNVSKQHMPVLYLMCQFPHTA